MLTFFSELKRRNIFRVAAVYLAAAWLIVQLGTTLSETFETPHWVMRFVVLLLALGFPAALGLAWAFEVTPDGLKRTHEVPRQESITRLTGRKLDFVIIGVLALALVFILLDAYVFQERNKTDTRSREATVASIAVLPFVDLSPKKDNEYFSDGISEELLNRLAKVDRFRVTGRTSSFAFKGKNEDLRTIGEKLGVESILEGSVRKENDRIRVTAQLISVHDGSHLWSDSYDRQLKGLFEIQDDIAREVVTALTRTLLGDPDAATAGIPVFARPTTNLEAYNSYLRGHYLLRKRIGKDMQQALVEFQRAVALDPNFAPAHVGIAKTLVLLVNYQGRNIADIAPPAEAAIARALELDPSLAEVYAAKYLLLSEQDTPFAERVPLIKRAIELDPNDAMSLHLLATGLREAGRPSAEVLSVRERAYAIDPVAPNVIYALATELYGAGQQARASSLATELAALTPDSDHYYRLRGEFAGMEGRMDEWARWSARAIKARPDNVEAYLQLGYAYEYLGDAEAAARQYEQARKLSPTNMWAVALLAVLRTYTRNTPGALQLLREAARTYPNDLDLRRAQAFYESTIGETHRSLAIVRTTDPLLFRAPPEILTPFPYYVAPMAVFLLRETGDTAGAATIAAAFHKFNDSWVRPGQKLDPDEMRVRMAAALGDRVGVAKYLDRLYRSGTALPAYDLPDPLFKPFLADPEMAPRLAKHAERRAEWRRQLAAEGL